MALLKLDSYTIEDIYSLPEGQRAELIDGQIYNMAPPNFLHQKLVHQFDKIIGNYIDAHGGDCEVMPAPFAVFLNEDNKNYVEPDISVICDRKKLDDYGCNGALDWIIEIISPSTQRMDYGMKLFKYRNAGVREYWIVDPIKKTVQVYFFEDEEYSEQFSFDEDISVHIYNDFKINLSELIK